MLAGRMIVPEWYNKDKILHRLIHGFFRFGTLNVVAELIALDTSNSHENGVKRYMDLMQLLGLIAALLLSLFTNVHLFLVKADHNARHLGTADDGGKH